MYPKKILLAVFIFGLVILAGKIIYSQFDSISASFIAAEHQGDLASMVAPEFFHQKAIESSKLAEPGLALYRSDVSKADVLWFYSHITGDETITRIILENASKNNISPSLAFALAWEESRYQPKAVNKNSSSIDRGLFPKLTEKDFFNVESNAHYGMSHLSYCIDLSGNEVTALAMYNAGTTKVRSDKTPKRTLDYIFRILSYRDGLERMFNQQVSSRYSISDKEIVSAANKK
jgi:soluble lytic murein transglycosylase-like protein